jgi:hypothetical protein
MHHVLIIAGLVAATAACKPDAVEAEAGGRTQAMNDEARVNDTQRAGEAARATAQTAAPGGAFARKPGFQLPVPVSSAPMRADSIPQSRPVDPVGIRTALMDGMEAAGAGIQVQVDPGGIVSLSGEVASVAEMQRAHYLARAQPGVVEVDYRNLRVRKR